MKLKAAWTALVSVLGFSSSVDEEDLPELTEKHWAKVNSSIGDLQKQVATLTTERDALKTQNDTLTKERDTLKAKVEEYGDQPGAKPTTPESKSKQDAIEGSADDLQAQLDELPHNKRADAETGTAKAKEE